MSEVVVTAVSDGDAWEVLKPDPDVSKIMPAAVHVFTFDNSVKRSALTVLRSRDRMQELPLTMGDMGAYNPEAYQIARMVAYLGTHCAKYIHETDGQSKEITLSDKSLEWIAEEIPMEVIEAYFRRANPTVKVSTILLPEPPKGEAQETDEAKRDLAVA